MVVIKVNLSKEGILLYLFFKEIKNAAKNITMNAKKRKKARSKCDNKIIVTMKKHMD